MCFLSPASILYQPGAPPYEKCCFMRSQKKILVPVDLTMGQFVYVIRKVRALSRQLRLEQLTLRSPRFAAGEADSRTSHLCLRLDGHATSIQHCSAGCLRQVQRRGRFPVHDVQVSEKRNDSLCPRQSHFFMLTSGLYTVICFARSGENTFGASSRTVQL